MTLTARTGDLSLTGQILGFDGTYLRLQIAQGEVTLDYAAMTCAGATCPDPARFVPSLRFSGAAEFVAVLPALIDGFAADLGLMVAPVAPDMVQLTGADGRVLVTFGLRATTTADGLADLIANEADAVLADRALTGAEVDLARRAGLGRLDTAGRVRILAHDALVPVAAPGQPVDAIQTTDLARVLTGEISNWAALGGPDRAITLYLQTDRLAQVASLVPRLSSRPDAVLTTDAMVAEDAAAAIAADPDGLGLLPFQAYGDTQPLLLADPCGLRARPRIGAVKAGDYPLTTPFFLYQPLRRLHPDAAGFLDWLAGPSAQVILRRAGHIGADPTPIPWDEQGERLANAIAAAGPDVSLGALQQMIGTLGPMTRLSPTFRFDSGTTRLDPSSQSHVMALARALRDGRFAGQTVLLAGFSDGRGPAAENQDLSAARAEAVLRALRQALAGLDPASVALTTAGFGEALPSGCDATPWGQEMNRRVELWVSGG